MENNLNRQELKTNFNKRSPLFGGWTSLGHPQITEMLACSGVDFIGVDIEHSTISQEQCQRIIASCNAEGVSYLPRVASHNLRGHQTLIGFWCRRSDSANS